MSGGRHINKDFSRRLLHQAENAEDSKQLIDAGRHNVHQSGKYFFLKRKIDMQSAGLHAQFRSQLFFNAGGPLPEFRNGINFHGAQLCIA